MFAAAQPRGVRRGAAGRRCRCISGKRWANVFLGFWPFPLLWLPHPSAVQVRAVNACPQPQRWARRLRPYRPQARAATGTVSHARCSGHKPAARRCCKSSTPPRRGLVTLAASHTHTVRWHSHLLLCTALQCCGPTDGVQRVPPHTCTSPGRRPSCPWSPLSLLLLLLLPLLLLPLSLLVFVLTSPAPVTAPAPGLVSSSSCCSPLLCVGRLTPPATLPPNPTPPDLPALALSVSSVPLYTPGLPRGPSAQFPTPLPHPATAAAT